MRTVQRSTNTTSVQADEPVGNRAKLSHRVMLGATARSLTLPLRSGSSFFRLPGCRSRRPSPPFAKSWAFITPGPLGLVGILANPRAARTTKIAEFRSPRDSVLHRYVWDGFALATMKPFVRSPT